MILVDSGVWIDYFSGNGSPETDFLDDALGVRAISTGDLILTEVLQGFRYDKDLKPPNGYSKNLRSMSYSEQGWQ